MKMRLLVAAGCFMYMFLFMPVKAHAQFSAKPFSDPATGENYHFEFAVELWNPPLDLKVASESLGQAGTTIDAVTDLGLAKKTLKEMRIVLRPAKKHKFHINYLPMTYTGESTIHREFVFNGQRFNVNLPITTQFEWKTWLIAYEYDFFYTDKGFVGFTLNSKFTKTLVNIKSPIVTEFASAQAPVPTIGGIARVYVVPNISITADINGIKIPDSVSEKYKAHYADLDIYGTVNFNNNIGLRGGYRSFDVGYLVESDTGSFVLNGIYFGIVARY